MKPVDFTTGRLTLDQPTRSDLDAIVEYCRDPVFEQVMTLPWPYEAKHAEYFIEELVPAGWASDTEYTWAIRHEAGGPLLGVIGLRLPSQMIGYWLGAPHRGLRVMPQALTGVLDWYFARGGARVAWECVLGNNASASVARACGFRYLGEGSAVIAARDGSRPPAWQGEILARDDRTHKPGWPQ